MSAKTKIVVLHMREVVYTILFFILAVILAVLMFFMFGPGKSMKTDAKEPARFQPGIYRSSVMLGDNTFDVEITVDSRNIQSIHLVNLSESTAAMFPLVKPALESLSSQIYQSQSLENIQYADDQKYTSMLLLNAIQSALKKAESQ